MKLGMAVLSIVAFLFCGRTHAAAPVPAQWVQKRITHSSYGGSYCSYLSTAVNTVLPAVEAKNIEFICRVRGGAVITFTSLFPASDNATIRAKWEPRNIALSLSGEGCYYVSEAISWLFSHLAVENSQSTILCQGDSGYLNYRFMALVADY